MNDSLQEINKLLNSGQFYKALNLTNSILPKYPQNKTLIKFLAQIYFKLDDYYKAIDTLSSNYDDNKSDFDFNNNLGFYLVHIEKYHEALKYIDIAKKIKKDAPTPYQNEGECYIYLKDFNLAEKSIEQSISLYEEKKRPYQEYYSVLILRIQIFLAKNDRSGAIKFIKKYLNKNIIPELVLQLSEIDSSQITDEIINQINDKLKQNVYSSIMAKFYEVVPYYFALANYYEYFKDHEKAEANYLQGNKEIFNIQRYNVIRNQKKIIEMIDVFEKNHNFNPPENENYQRRIFIVGMPRSGTSLLESIITANDYVFAAGELKSFDLLYDKYIATGDFNIDESFSHVGKEYNAITNSMKGDYPAIVDKMPGNYHFMGFILKCLPGAKIILLKRNHWDIAISLFKQRYASNIPYASSFFNIGVYIANFEAICSFWMKNRAISEKVLVIEYEELVTKSDQITQKVYDHCKIGSSYDPDVREKHFAKTASINQVGKKINTSSVMKKDFISQKNEFLEAYESQKEFWKLKGIEIR
tara:strand:- start:197 stop:1780 length:1584 start_codon:yes stop_codon:yes gene_type:complete